MLCQIFQLHLKQVSLIKDRGSLTFDKLIKIERILVFRFIVTVKNVCR